MKNEIEFKCPYCGGKAIYYLTSKQAGCIYHGWLLYTDIPRRVIRSSERYNHKVKGWATISDVLNTAAMFRAIDNEIKRFLKSKGF